MVLYIAGMKQDAVATSPIAEKLVAALGVFGGQCCQWMKTLRVENLHAKPRKRGADGKLPHRHTSHW